MESSRKELDPIVNHHQVVKVELRAGVTRAVSLLGTRLLDPRLPNGPNNNLEVRRKPGIRTTEKMERRTTTVMIW